MLGLKENRSNEDGENNRTSVFIVAVHVEFKPFINSQVESKKEPLKELI